MAITARILRPGDEGGLEAFLKRHADSSMFLRGNLRRGGLIDRGEAYQATYVGAFDGAALAGVAAISWGGYLQLQAPAYLAEAVRAVDAARPRAIKGISGPFDQVMAARAALGLTERVTSLDSAEDLFGLDLADLVVPENLASGELTCRQAGPDDMPLLVDWRRRYQVEHLNADDDAATLRDARADVNRHLANGAVWLLENNGLPPREVAPLDRSRRDRPAREAWPMAMPVAQANYNSQLPDMVQIGGVWTPPSLRGHGYARAAVAGALLAARARGVARAVLFTGRDNPAAQRAYRALVFAVVGDYAVVHFSEPVA